MASLTECSLLHLTIWPDVVEYSRNNSTRTRHGEQLPKYLRHIGMVGWESGDLGFAKSSHFLSRSLPTTNSRLLGSKDLFPPLEV